MSTEIPQPGLFDNEPESHIYFDDARHALDGLFYLAKQFQTSREYFDLLQFAGEFHWYSLYNAWLVRMQKPGAEFVARADKWYYEYKREIRPGAQPLVALRPMGPVMFLFDVVDTIAMPDAPPLPQQAENPYQAKGLGATDFLDKASRNAQRDGIEIYGSRTGSLDAGLIQEVEPGRIKNVRFGTGTKARVEPIPVRYGIAINENQDDVTRFATLAHELAHLYCGHLGTPSDQWWPDRRHVTHVVRELEAESVSYLVCKRLAIETPSEKYLSDFVERHDHVLAIGMDVIVRAASLIIAMATERLPARKSLKEDK